jgi:hypothetical protein
MTTTQPTSRNWLLTLTCIPLFLVALWFSIAAWFITFEGSVPFEPAARLTLCLIFAYSAYKLAVVIKRGYLKVRMRDIARDFFGGIQ